MGVAMMRTLIAAMAALFCLGASAETVEQQLKARIDAASERADRLSAQGRGPIAPRVDALPQPQAAPTVDVGALSQRYEQMAHEQAAQVLTPAGLLAFVSFAMPNASLERMVSEAERTNTVLVLRGLVEEDLAKTFQQVRALLGERKVGWVLDSEAFKRFDIRVTPTYVLLKPGVTFRECELGQCYREGDYLKLSGDVPIAYVLEHFERERGFAQAVASVRRGRGS